MAHTRYDSSSQRDRPVAETSTWQHTTLTTNLNTLGGIRTHNPSKASGLRPRGQPGSATFEPTTFEILTWRSQTLVPIQHQTVKTDNRSRLRLKCDGTRAENRFRRSAKRTSPFKSAGASVQSTTGSRDVRISGSNAGYTMFRRSVKGTGYPLRSPVSPSLPLPASLCAITFQLDSTDRPTQRVTNSPFPLVATLSLLPRASRFLPNEETLPEI